MGPSAERGQAIKVATLTLSLIFFIVILSPLTYEFVNNNRFIGADAKKHHHRQNQNQVDQQHTQFQHHQRGTDQWLRAFGGAQLDNENKSLRRRCHNNDTKSKSLMGPRVGGLQPTRFRPQHEDWLKVCPNSCPSVKRPAKKQQQTPASQIEVEVANNVGLCGSDGCRYSSICHMLQMSCRLDSFIWPVHPSYCGQHHHHEDENENENADNQNEADRLNGDDDTDDEMEIASDTEIDEDDEDQDEEDEASKANDDNRQKQQRAGDRLRWFKAKLFATDNHRLESSSDVALVCTRDLYKQMMILLASKFNGDPTRIFGHFDRNSDSKISAKEFWLDANESQALFDNQSASLTTSTSASSTTPTKLTEAPTNTYILDPITKENPCSLGHIILFEDRNHDNTLDLEEIIGAFERHKITPRNDIRSSPDKLVGLNSDKQVEARQQHQAETVYWEANLGDSLELKCKLDSDSINDGRDMTTDIDWFRNGVSLRQMLLTLMPANSSIKITRESRLLFKSLQFYMAGKYICRRRGDQLQREQHHQVHVSVPARVTVRPAFQWAPIGSQAHLECQYEYLPLIFGQRAKLPHVRWFKNDSQLRDRNSLNQQSNSSNLAASSTEFQNEEKLADDGFYEYDSQRQQQQQYNQITQSSAGFGLQDDEVTTIDGDGDKGSQFDVDQSSNKATITMSSSRLTINSLAPSDTGSISCRVSLSSGIPASSSGTSSPNQINGASTVGFDYGSLLVQDDPARVVEDDLDSGREHLWLFHDNGITIYSLSMNGADDQMQLVRDFTGHTTIPPQIDNNWNQLTLCGGLNPDEAVICEWSDNAILLVPQLTAPFSQTMMDRDRHRRTRRQQVGYVYVGQPNLNRLLVFDSQQFEIVSILNTDPQPKQLWLYNSLVPPHSAPPSTAPSGAEKMLPASLLTSPMENYHKQHYHHQSDELFNGRTTGLKFRSDIWILCHGQPLVVDTTSGNENSNSNLLTTFQDGVGSEILIKFGQSMKSSSYNNNKDPEAMAAASWQQQISNKEQRLRNRRSVQIIRTTTRTPRSSGGSSSEHQPAEKQEHYSVANNDQEVSDSVRRFKTSLSTISYHLKSDHPFGLIHDLYMPHIASPLADNVRHHVQYAYVSHYDERKLVRINMDKMASDNIIDLGDCVPIYQLTTASGLLIIQCRTPITHQLKGQLVLDQLTNSFISYNPDIQAQRSFLSPDHRYLVSIYAEYSSYEGGSINKHQQSQTEPRIRLAPNISTSTIVANSNDRPSSTNRTNDNKGNTNKGRIASAKIIVQKITSKGLEFQYDVKTSLYIIDCAFVWRNGDYDAILVSGLGQQDEILSLRLLDGRVELISGILGRIGNQHSSLKVSDRSKLAAIATDRGVYVLDMEDSRVKCQVPKHHQFTAATLLWV